MAKKKNTRKQAQAAKAKAAGPKQMDRRDMLRLARNGGIAAAVLGVGGYFGLGMVRAGAAEYDLSRIGQGTPTVVQVHDPQCPVCTSLQKETRRALRGFEDDELLYLIADITNVEGRALAARHNVPHVTLLLFDGAGGLRQILQGMQDSDVLREAFQAHLDSV